MTCTAVRWLAVLSLYNHMASAAQFLHVTLEHAAFGFDTQRAREQEGRRLGPKPRTRKMIGMISVILAAIALIMIGYLAVGFAGYLAFPRTVSSNVLKTFPDTAIMQVPFECSGGLLICLAISQMQPATVDDF